MGERTPGPAEGLPTSLSLRSRSGGGYFVDVRGQQRVDCSYDRDESAVINLELAAALGGVYEVFTG